MINTTDAMKVDFTIYALQHCWNPLWEASRNGHLDVVKALIGAKAEVNLEDVVSLLLIKIITNS